MSDLGDYLRARRAALTPEELRLPTTGHRRVPGLRREEVAMLAGVSVDYYVRLEQGRETGPSASVLEALAAALRLDDDGRLHLFRLAGLAPRARRETRTSRVDPGLRQLMDAWADQPALVYDQAYDVLAANELAEELFGRDAPRNLMELVFLDPAGRSIYADWDAVARNAVAGFRAGHGADPTHPRTREVLARLLEESPAFAALWAEHDARGKRAETKAFDHPQVGRLTLDMQTFDVRSTPGQELVVYHAEPGSSSAEALALLGALAATRRTSTL